MQKKNKKTLSPKDTENETFQKAFWWKEQGRDCKQCHGLLQKESIGMHVHIVNQ